MEEIKQEMIFLGHDIKYWIELENRAKELEVTDFIEEIVQLRGKLSFIQKRTNEIFLMLEKSERIKQ
jgi:hypothetical protein